MKINYRQMCVLVFLSMIALKFLALPSLLYIHAKNMGFIVSFVIMTIDAIYAFLILSLMEKSQEKNIYEFMQKIIGKIGAKLVLVILLVQFALIVADLSKGLEFFVVENLYNELNWTVFVIPLMILISFMVYKGVRNIARVGEIFCWFICLGILYIGLKSMSGIDLESFLPMFNDGVTPLFEAAWHHMMWFGSTSFLLVLFGKVDFTDKKKMKLFWTLTIAILLVHFMYLVFYGLFQVTSGIHNFMISDISQFSTEHSSIDELSWLVVSLWIVAQAIQLALYAYCMKQCIKFIFNLRNNTIPIATIIIYLLLWSLAGENSVSLEKTFYSPYMSIVTIVSQYIIPLILFVAYHLRKKLRTQGGRHEEAKVSI